MHTLKILVSYSQLTAPLKSPIILTFADGLLLLCDLLVGAGGIKSVICGCMMCEIAWTSSEQAVENYGFSF